MFLKTRWLAPLFIAMSLAPAWASASGASDDAACIDCVDQTGEHEANDTNLYCWRLGNVLAPDAQGRCPTGWRKSTIGAESQFRNRHLDKCEVAAALAEPPPCEVGCTGDASITQRRVTATSCFIEKKRDCAPIGRCALEGSGS